MCTVSVQVSVHRCAWMASSSQDSHLITCLFDCNLQKSLVFTQKTNILRKKYFYTVFHDFHWKTFSLPLFFFFFLSFQSQTSLTVYVTYLSFGKVDKNVLCAVITVCWNHKLNQCRHTEELSNALKTYSGLPAYLLLHWEKHVVYEIVKYIKWNTWIDEEALMKTSDPNRARRDTDWTKKCW